MVFLNCPTRYLPLPHGAGVEAKIKRSPKELNIVRAQLVLSFSHSGFCVLFCNGVVCVIALTILELAVHADQAVVKLTEIHLSLPPKCWD